MTGEALQIHRYPCVEPLVTNAVADKMEPIPYHQQRLEGLLGKRLDINVSKGLLGCPVEDYLKPYWTDRLAKWPAGEYLGKYVQGDAMAYQYSGSDELMDQLRDIAETWVETLPEDGYHVVKAPYEWDRWAGAWEVWELKYVLIGLTSIYSITGDERLLDTARHIGDLLCSSFGYGEGQRDLIEVGALRLGTTSVLEPMTYLYRYTGEQKYLDFCNYIMQAHEQDPNGTKIISELLRGSREVYHVGGPGQWQKGKAYEMISSFIGVLRMYQLTGEQEYLDAMLVAWEDIQENRLFVTGTTSNREFFRHKHVLPGEGGDHGGEGCVTAHWLFFNRVLFYITGELKYIDEIETTLYNALIGSQDPHLGLQSYFTPLNGQKRFERYSINTGGPPCCISSVARAIARTPEAIWVKPREGGVAVLLYTPGSFCDKVKAQDGSETELGLEVQTDFPKSGKATITLKPEAPAEIKLFLRVPGWCTSYTASIGGETFQGTPGEYVEITRTWQAGDTVAVGMDLPVRLAPGEHSYPGHFAVKRGPQVLAVDSMVNEGEIAEATIDPSGNLDLEDASDRLPEGWFGDQAYTAPSIAVEHGKPAVLVPYADAGQFGVTYEERLWEPHHYRVWIRDVNAPAMKWTRIQDTDSAWVITGEYTRETYDEVSNRTHTHVADGGTLEIQFTGSQVRIFGMRGREHGHADVVIDGTVYPDIKWYELGDTPGAHTFTSRLLDPRSHTLQVVAKGTITLDYIEVLTIQA